MRKTTLADIISALNKNGPVHPVLGTSCWLWTRPLNAGYGRVWMEGKHVYVHRVMWESEHGPLPEGMCALHACDNQQCCRPDHMFMGTQLDNVRDMDSKGRRGKALGNRNGTHTKPERLPCGDEHWSRRHPEWVPKGEDSGSVKHPESRPRGEKHAMAKLTWEEVRAMRASSGKQRDIAKAFGVSQRTVWRILHGLSWKE